MAHRQSVTGGYKQEAMYKTDPGAAIVNDHVSYFTHHFTLRQFILLRKVKTSDNIHIQNKY